MMSASVAHAPLNVKYSRTGQANFQRTNPEQIAQMTTPQNLQQQIQQMHAGRPEHQASAGLSHISSTQPQHEISEVPSFLEFHDPDTYLGGMSSGLGAGTDFGSLDPAGRHSRTNTTGLLSQQLPSGQPEPLETDDHFSKLRQHRIKRLQSAGRYAQGAKRSAKTGGGATYLGAAQAVSRKTKKDDMLDCRNLVKEEAAERSLQL